MLQTTRQVELVSQKTWLQWKCIERIHAPQSSLLGRHVVELQQTQRAAQGGLGDAP